MSELKETDADPQGNEAADTYVVDYLAQAEEGRAPELDRYLERVPPAYREVCRERIQTASRVRGVLSQLRQGANRTEKEAPVVKGFRIEREIGQGGLGKVYAAWDEVLERRVALKVLRRGTAADLRARILREARRAAAFQDPAIVTIFSVVDEGEYPAIVMEHVEGYPIDRGAASLTFRQKAKLLQAVARALAMAHERGIIHRDLKPENVLITPELRPKILDFGLALSLERDAGPRGLFEGTPLYASPEQVEGKGLAPASDIFSFGSLMFAVLTGKPPFQGASVQEVFEKITGSDPPFPRNVATGIPEDLQAICLSCLAREPEERPTAEEVATDLGRYLAGEPARLRPALYRDILRRRIAAHIDDLREWERQGMISPQEGDRLSLVYRRILADEDHWIVDARKLTLTQTILYTASWVVVVAAVLLVWLARNDVSPVVRWLAPVAGSAFLLGVGFFAHSRKEHLASASCLAGAILSLVPTALSLLAELELFGQRPAGVEQLLGPPFSNLQILIASLSGLCLSAVALWRLQMAGFAWTTAILATASYLGMLLLLDWLGKKPEVQALWCLPLVGLEGIALLSENRDRVRWALPFHLLTLVVLVACLDVIAVQGPTLKLLGLAPGSGPGKAAAFLNPEREEAFSLALNGVAFLLLMTLMERSKSLDLRRGSHILGVLASIHLLGSLYRNALEQRRLETVAIDVSIYLAAVLLLLLLGPWRGRRQFLISGLAGIALGSHLLIDLELVAKAPFVLCLGFAGILVALGTYAYLHFRPRAGGP